jgi:hypothetical protein
LQVERRVDGGDRLRQESEVPSARVHVPIVAAAGGL